MSTYIDGIAASEALDTAGEIVDLAGLDITSLVGSVFNFEHLSQTPDQIIGKILQAKKIFSDKDCETERQAYFWEKCQIPFLYVLGELFDDYKDSAKEIAGLFRYDADKRGETPMDTLGFSIEGAKINKTGHIITHSIARKVTITAAPANKTCLAEMVPSQEKAPKDDLSNIFKSEFSVEIELVKSEDVGRLLKKEDPSEHAKKLGISPMKKDLGGGLSVGASSALSGGGPTSPSLMGSEKKTMKKAMIPSLSIAKPGNKSGASIGKTKSGKDVMSHGRVGEYNFSPEEHGEAASLHTAAAQAAKDAKTGKHHNDKAMLHTGAANTARDRQERISAKPAARTSAPSSSSIPGYRQSFDPAKSGKMPKPGPVKKSMTAGSGMAAPSALEGGAALAKEDLAKISKQEPTIKPPTMSRPDNGFGAIIHKNDNKWLKRAEQEYAKWEKREQFEKFMAKRMPHLTKGEIKAIGQTLSLTKTLEAEKAMSKLGKALTFNHPKNHIPSKENATPKSNVPEKFKNKKHPDFKGHVDTEVEHVEPHYSGSHDTVYLASGHVSEGHKPGKFKVGDKVSAKQHIMGTHILEHKK